MDNNDNNDNFDDSNKTINMLFVIKGIQLNICIVIIMILGIHVSLDWISVSHYFHKCPRQKNEKYHQIIFDGVVEKEVNMIMMKHC